MQNRLNFHSLAFELHLRVHVSHTTRASVDITDSDRSRLLPRPDPVCDHRQSLRGIPGNQIDEGLIITLWWGTAWLCTYVGRDLGARGFCLPCSG